MPPFQRSYAWSEDQALQLFDDLYTSHTLADRGTGTEYFLGPIILRDIDSQHREIVDGQQRIVTLAALLAVIRDRIQDAELKKELQAHLYRIANTALQFGNSPRIIMMNIDQNDFERLVINAGGTISNCALSSRSIKRLAQIVSKFHKDFPDISSESISKFASFILTRCSVVVLTTTSPDAARKLFKSVNTPGQPLSDVAFARHELIANNPPQTAWELAEAWDQLADDQDEEQLRA